ncbi:ACP S-malonyltransferase [Leadbettera azotonutricia]|uniref:Malonyl CoA-acyl carrier protein transacylase n=1 Tax=Leadbettera azotonutricia (strain ATCC BAA-888 / DSM 13862 / ZAS-9) TaxID=545695 RepID=F5Y6Q0_LEAAZ|nr:ACP S-malonyltransferase [Leadbettera azotonutricia]AEF80587.1 [acyl-carrier-protein] S-malonyltransferase [Leadbettera azotonutricia ZAS-9]
MISRAFLLFPGQGAQYPGMALDILESSPAAQKLFALASSITGRDMKSLLKNSDAETLKRTDISQPAITLANLAAAAWLAEKGIKPSGVAGFSLGEYAALAAAGVLSEEDCFLLAAERGKAMQASADRIKADAGSGSAPGMAAVIGLAPDQVEGLIAEWKKEGAPFDKLFAANINSSRQTVVSGTAEALAESARRFIEAGCKRVIPLAVAGPFHSPLIADAAEAFRPFLEKARFNNPVLPLYSNVSGKPVSSGEEARKLALAQITSPVRWTDEEAAIQSAEGFDVCLEAGPGKVLQGLWKDSGSALPCLAAGTLIDLEKLLA